MVELERGAKVDGLDDDVLARRAVVRVGLNDGAVEGEGGGGEREGEDFGDGGRGGGDGAVREGVVREGSRGRGDDFGGREGDEG